MTALEQQLLARVESLERNLARLLIEKGKDPDAMDEYLHQEAVQHMKQTHDPSKIRDYLKSKIAKRRAGHETGCKNGLVSND